MIDLDTISDTFQPIDDNVGLNGSYGQPLLLMSTASARIYRITKAGKRMLLKTPIDESGRSLELLKREYALGVGLSHPNIAAIYTWEPTTPAGPGILMEYVDGRTLNEFIAENPPLNARRRVMQQLLDAVNYIHKHGVTHNDLKPGNIMVSRANDDVKIIDFGMADADGEALQRQLGGTVGYASPELAARDGSADMRSDIYSIGVIMRDIFGSRYRRLWRKCMAERPQGRYRNVDSLMKAWHWSNKLPVMLWSLAAALLLSGILAFGILKIENLVQEVDNYSLSSQQMADTIAALRQKQLTSTDSISQLKLRLAEIRRDKAMTDSLTNAYVSSATKVIDRYKAIACKFRCVDEAYHMFKLYNADMDRNDSIFLSRNPIAGRDIYDKYAMSVRLRGTNEIDKLVKTLPFIQDLTNDIEELMSVIPLIQSGQPWSLKSDSE